MECVPVLRLLVEHTAERVLPLPLRAIAAQPAMELPPSVKLTLPVGLKPVTEAVNVTLVPAAEGLAELDSVVVVATTLLEPSVTASTKVVRSLGSVPANVSVCAPLLTTEKPMLNAAKLPLAGDTRLPIWAPSTVTLTGCTPQQVRCAALNDSV